MALTIVLGLAWPVGAVAQAVAVPDAATPVDLPREPTPGRIVYHRERLATLQARIAAEPLARDAEAWQHECIQAADVLRDETGQVSLRRRYVEQFRKGSPWRKRWVADAAWMAEVDGRLFRVLVDLAQRLHYQAQLQRAEGAPGWEDRYLQVEPLYAEAQALAPRPEQAYWFAWIRAEVLDSASGRGCWGVPDRTHPLEVIDENGELQPHPPEAVAAVKRACSHARRAVAAYLDVAAWKGPKGVGEDGQRLDYSGEALGSAAWLYRRLLVARAALPVSDPDHLDARQVPGIERRGDSAAEEEGWNWRIAKEVSPALRSIPRRMDPDAEAWLRTVDAYLATAPAEREVAETLRLHAAELLYQYGHFDPWYVGRPVGDRPEAWSARARLWRLVEAKPPSRAAYDAADLVVQSYAIEKDAAGLAAALTRAAQALPARQAGRSVPCVRIFYSGDEHLRRPNRLAARPPSDPTLMPRWARRVRMWYSDAGDTLAGLACRGEWTIANAVFAYEQAGRWDDALTLLRKLSVRAPKPSDHLFPTANAYTSTLWARIAMLQHKLLDFEQAAVAWEAAYRADPVDFAVSGRAIASAAHAAATTGRRELAHTWIAKLGANFTRLARQAVAARQDQSAAKERTALAATLWRLVDASQDDPTGQTLALQALIAGLGTTPDERVQTLRALDRLAALQEPRAAAVTYRRILAIPFPYGANADVAAARAHARWGRLEPAFRRALAGGPPGTLGRAYAALITPEQPARWRVAAALRLAALQTAGRMAGDPRKTLEPLQDVALGLAGSDPWHQAFSTRWASLQPLGSPDRHRPLLVLPRPAPPLPGAERGLR